MPGNGAIEGLLRRDRAVVLGMLVAVIVAAWAYVLNGAGMGMSALDMSSLDMALGRGAEMPMPGAADQGVAGSTMTGMSTASDATSKTTGGMSQMGRMPAPMQAMATPASWDFDYYVLMFFMWWVMMIAMMLPSAAPMVLLHAAVLRKGAAAQGGPRAPWSTAAFTVGYLAAWAGFSAIAAAFQWAFEAVGVLSPMMLNSTSALFAAGILLFAGLYQLTPIKQACLRHCRGPIQFLTQHWHPGASGAFRMGLHHGAYCLGCCWGLMAILLFGGIMNLYWVIGLAVIVLLEKIVPVGRQLSFVTGALFLAWGGFYLHRALA
jgi:predicted metal-binding membrane protein